MSTQTSISGTHELGPVNGNLTVRTARAGAAARMGHDLVIDATRWSAALTIDETAPDRSSLQITVDATSFEIREASGGVKALSDKERGEILKNIAKKVLSTDRHPEIRFASTSVQVTDSGTVDADGDLTLAGTTKPVQVRINLEDPAGQPTLTATMPLVQSDFGIKPYSAMMGALKVADEVTIEARARPAAG